MDRPSILWRSYNRYSALATLFMLPGHTPIPHHSYPADVVTMIPKVEEPKAGRDDAVAKAQKAHPLVHSALPALLHHGSVLFPTAFDVGYYLVRHSLVASLLFPRHILLIPYSSHRVFPRCLERTKYPITNRIFSSTITRDSKRMYTQFSIDLHSRMVR